MGQQKVEERQTRGRAEPAEATRPSIDPSSFQVRRSGCERRGGELHVCPRCDSGLVYPIEWTPARPDHWTVLLRCPECEWSNEGVYGQPALERFDEMLDEGTEEILADLKALARVNLEDEIERFAAALQAGQILPEDF